MRGPRLVSERYLLVCCAERDGGQPACGCSGREVFLAVQSAVDRLRETDRFQVTATACLGMCAEGPVTVSEPHTGRTWTGVQLEDIEELVRSLGDKDRVDPGR